MIRWLDFNDTWLAAEWGHPSDNLGGILAVADYLARAVMEGKSPPTVRDVLTGMIKAHEIQGVLALENSFNRVGLDHVILVRVASTAVVTAMLGGSARTDRERRFERLDRRRRAAHLSACTEHRFAQELGGGRCHQPRRAACLHLAQGRDGLPLRAEREDLGLLRRVVQGKPFSLPQPFGSYVMENVLFKISFPAEFHAQTAVEAAMTLHPQVKDRVLDIERIVIETQEPGRSHHRQDRPAGESRRSRSLHSVHGGHSAAVRPAHRADYEDKIASDPRVDALRAKMEVRENTTFTQEYYAPTSATSATPCRCSSATALRPSACTWTFRSATASAAPRACRCSCRSSREGLIYQGAQQRAVTSADLHVEFLKHEDHAHSFDRVDPKIGPQCTSPVEVARRSRYGREAGLHADPHTQSIALAQMRQGRGNP
jgi:2-methylcitrate dehydratase